MGRYELLGIGKINAKRGCVGGAWHPVVVGEMMKGCRRVAVVNNRAVDMTACDIMDLIAVGDDMEELGTKHSLLRLIGDVGELVGTVQVVIKLWSGNGM